MPRSIAPRLTTATRPLVLAVVTIMLVAACSSTSGSDGSATTDEVITSVEPAASPAVDVGTDNVADHDDPADHEWDEADEVGIELTGDTATTDGPGASVDGGIITITAAGTYRLSGDLDDGRILVASPGDGIVRLVLDGVTIASSTGAAIHVADADEVMVYLADGSTNELVDAATYTDVDPTSDEPNATLFSTADLTVAGVGSLTVEGNANDGIASKGGLVIAGGTILVDAVDDGIRGKDYVVVVDGTVTVTAGGDGLKADNDEDAARGYIEVDGGSLTVEAGGDGLDAATDVIVAGGDLTVTAGGGATATVAADASAKGLKGDVSVTIAGGTIRVDAADDAVHSNDTIVMTGGDVTVATGDDGFHADASLTVSGGTLDIGTSYEGLESSAIVIEGGSIAVVASDDGLNAAGGQDGSGFEQAGGGPGRDAFAQGGDSSIVIAGGALVVDADGDGIDANGTVTMTGGTVIVDGPTSNGNGALDFGSFSISGGLLVASGSAGMAQVPDTTGGQLSLHAIFASTQAAGTVVHVQSADGTGIVTFTPSKAWQSFVVSTPDISADATYEVYIGGAASGETLAGLLVDGTYAPGELAGTTTTADAVSQGPGGGPGGPGVP